MEKGKKLSLMRTRKICGGKTLLCTWPGSSAKIWIPLDRLHERALAMERP